MNSTQPNPETHERHAPGPGASPKAKDSTPPQAPVGSELTERSQNSAGVKAYYNHKTASILKKYGPGPRVHFHIGLYDKDPLRPGLDMEQLRTGIVSAQERMIAHAAEVWEADWALSGDILDVGCGLGGGSLYWATEHGARVTAVTIASEHIEMVRKFAAQAGVANRVETLLSDCCEVPTGHRYDGAVAMESACYFPRWQWFRRLAELIRPGGFVCIEDTFLGAPEWKIPFDNYWHTDIAPVDEYVSAARAAGFVLDRAEDVTQLTTPFWLQSAAWSKRVLASGQLSDHEAARLRTSIDWHHQFSRAWKEGAIDVQLLRFRHRG